MALASAAAENAAVNGVTAIAPYLSLHTATPGTTGASEVAGGSYARQSVTWGAASGGSATNTNAPAVPVPASTTVTHFGTWSAASAGTYAVGGALTASIAVGTTAATVTFTASAITLSAA